VSCTRTSPPGLLDESHAERRDFHFHLLSRRSVMGKYLLGWVLGVPLFVLVIIYFFMR
jgi:hypothetical protein